MAIFRMSAAVPWIGAFVAIRSALPRTVNERLWISGMYRTRPNSVVTLPVLRASTSVRSRYSWIFG